MLIFLKNTELWTRVCICWSANKLSSLYDMGFSLDDCKRALDRNKMNLTEAAVWLTENVTPEKRDKVEGGLSITGIEVSEGWI